jgi:hypothetical protein
MVGVAGRQQQRWHLAGCSGGGLAAIACGLAAAVGGHVSGMCAHASKCQATGRLQVRAWIGCH